MITNLIKVQEFMLNKNICLLGNSNSILKHPKNIDSYDIICRINRGSPIGREKYIGSRTDILFLATRMEENIINSIFKPKYVIWTTKDVRLQSKWIKEHAIQNPPEDWQELKDTLATLPSTGCVAINFLVKYIAFNKLTLVGFDFFKSGTFYHHARQTWHDGANEEQYIRYLIRNESNITLLEE